MAHKYQTFADLLYASYSGLQTLGFAFAKGKRRASATEDACRNPAADGCRIEQGRSNL